VSTNSTTSALSEGNL